MGKTSRDDVSVLEDASLVRSEVPILVTLHLEEAPFAGFYGDIVTGDVLLASDLLIPVEEVPSLPTTPSHAHASHESLGDF